MTQDRGFLLTEQQNIQSRHLETMPALDFVHLMNQQDQVVVAAIAQIAPVIAEAITQTAARLAQGGRLFYIGAGTSGRLGVLDASECPPTFCTTPELVQGIIAGGYTALTRSAEGAEDDAEAGKQALITAELTAQDVVVGITAGGTTPYVHGALRVAQEIGALSIFFACVPTEQVKAAYDIELRPLVGAEILTGSTRLKAGTATKMVLNMLSTGVMIALGKVYDNLMVDVAVTNQKLHDRAVRILITLTGLDRLGATELLNRADNRVKVALVMQQRRLGVLEAEHWLTQHQGSLLSLS